MLHIEILKAFYLKSPTSQRMNWRQHLVNSKGILVISLESIWMKAKLPIENYCPCQHIPCCLISQCMSSIDSFKV